MLIKKQIKYGGRVLTVETGFVAKQTSSSLFIDVDGTSVLITVVSCENKCEKDFFPLRIDYQERYYASGKIPGGFFRREGRPVEKEILISRLIDRSLRPLFPDNYFDEVQIVVTVMSINPDVRSDIISIIGASIALSISDIPFDGPIAAANVGYIDNKFLLNPNQSDLRNSKLDLVMSCSKDSVLMVESSSSELSEKIILDGIFFAKEESQCVINMVNDLINEIAVKKKKISFLDGKDILEKHILSNFKHKIVEIYKIADKIKRKCLLKDLYDVILFNLKEKNFDFSYEENDILFLLKNIEKTIFRNFIIKNKIRIDGRSFDSIREINTKIGFLSRTHGSAIFTRGETQVLSVVTLGTKKDAQIVDTPYSFVDQKNEFMLHYNFPPYCVNEIGSIGGVKRREVGHGHLIKKGILSVMPKNSEFPYVVRVVAEVTESNGSSSMASICSSSLSLMNAGVPIKSHVAGIAMGLIKYENSFVVLSDIIDIEDYFGDMDFKIAGTKNGITALQIDIKTFGINKDIIFKSLNQARKGINFILNLMDKCISKSNKFVSKYAPKIVSFKINVDKIKNIIGKGGSVIRNLTEQNNVNIEIKNDGTVFVISNSDKDNMHVCETIKKMVSDVEVGMIYTGKVVNLTEFGAFINILPGKDGLLHISQVSNHHVKNINDKLKEGQLIKVRVISVDSNGKIRLSMKDID